MFSNAGSNEKPDFAEKAAKKLPPAFALTFPILIYAYQPPEISAISKRLTGTNFVQVFVHEEFEQIAGVISLVPSRKPSGFDKLHAKSILFYWQGICKQVN